MAQGTRRPASATMAPNGTVVHEPAIGAVNRKKQKRREKEAARRAAQEPPAPTLLKNGLVSKPSAPAPKAALPRQPVPQYVEPELDEPLYDTEGEFYSDEEVEHYDHAYGTNGHYQQPYNQTQMSSRTSKKSRKKKKTLSVPPPLRYSNQIATHNEPSTADSVSKSAPKKDRIWNTSTQEERERIREFWLSLGEEERKSLVKIEKEAVLRKMKEQQKHSCSCTVCGRKRTAIEEELEVLYDAYYEELEHYAFSAPTSRPMLNAPPPSHPPGHYDDDEDEFSGGDYSDDESSEGDYSSEERSLPPPEASDFLHFGSSLQVKGGILTVADDLLKNDGKKFIEMMEQLAERRMQREEQAEYAAHPTMYRGHGAHNHEPPPEEDEFDEEGEEEEGYEDEDYEDDDEEEDDAMTEEQRMEEGRRMFQIFAARMFEQRVLQAYREKVAAERQQRLLEEIAEEDVRKDQKEAKKAKEAQKRKEKKDKQKQLKAEEKAKKEAEQAAKEAEIKAAEDLRLEEQRKKREEQRKKKDAERKAQDEEKQKREADRLKRQQDERERQQEAEKKAREQKAQEKKARDNTKRKEREEREAKEKEIREKKAHDDNQRREREAKVKADKDRARKEDHAPLTVSQHPATGVRKTSQPIAVALLPQLLKQTSSTGMPSPHVMPVVPKAPTPNRPAHASQQGSLGSSPKTPQAVGGTSKSTSPIAQVPNPIVPRSILTKPSVTQMPMPNHHGQSTSPMLPMGPPPGMQGPPGLGMSNMPPGLNGFPGQGSMGPGMMGSRPGMPFFPPQPGAQNFRPFPPPGMHAPSVLPMGRGFPMEGPPGFPAPPGFPGPNQMPTYGMGMSSHSRQNSANIDRTPILDLPMAAPQAQPIQRPAPIKRPSSVKPNDENKRAPASDIDDLADHLGSKALLDDEEDMSDLLERRPSLPHHSALRGGPPLGFGYSDGPSHLRSESYGSFGGPSTGSIWGTPPLPFPSNGATWGNPPSSGPFNTSFPSAMPRMYERGVNEQRLVWLRRMVCSACKTIAIRSPAQDGYVDANEVHHQIDVARNPMEPAVSLDEVKEACDIIDGTATNGGGTLEYKEVAGRLSHIKFIDAAAPPPVLGEIGSPVPSHSVLVGGYGRFPGLGPQGF